ncbi:hypothetical protein [Thalassovita sp.]|uniref:hypothetical protein n=1 Tax=Thalassovita sp. TaxID=1979401 RepID=UPI002880FD42|nr:hypothetical protein [Thalassovita sp.]MDF1802382.1 hypothetical protein [Thalassovita sp.]
MDVSTHQDFGQCPANLFPNPELTHTGAGTERFVSLGHASHLSLRKGFAKQNANRYEGETLDFLEYDR